MSAFETIDKITTVNSLIFLIIFTGCLGSITLIIFLRGQFKDMPCIVKIAFIGFFLSWLLQIGEFTVYFMTGMPSQPSKFLIGIGHIAITIFCYVHWMFVSHYLQAACLFTFVFSRRKHSEFELRSMKYRRNWLTILDIAAYIYILLFNGLGYWFKSSITLGAMALCFFLSLALICLFSMRHIHKCSKPLESMGIFPSSWNMRLYAICWLTLTTSYAF